MDFVDATILRLADESARDAVFDADSLSQLLAASHDATGTGLEEPFAAVFDEISFVHDDDSRVDIDGSWMTMGQTERTEVALRAAGLARPIPRIDLLFTGAVLATSRSGGSRISSVDLSWLELAGIDGEITPLPGDPLVLEQRRRERLVARIRTHLDQPDVFDDAALTRWLKRLGVDSLTELMTRPRPAAGATLQVTFGEGPDETARRRRFPLAAALLIRDMPVSLASLLDETRRLRPHLNRLGFRSGEAGARARRSPIVAWVLPGTLFDDVAWPGGSTGSATERRVQRRRWAGAWLARERIGLIVPT
jgi:hypothetical protein